MNVFLLLLAVLLLHATLAQDEDGNSGNGNDDQNFEDGGFFEGVGDFTGTKTASPTINVVAALGRGVPTANPTFPPTLNPTQEDFFIPPPDALPALPGIPPPSPPSTSPPAGVPPTGSPTWVPTRSPSYFPTGEDGAPFNEQEAPQPSAATVVRTGSSAPLGLAVACIVVLIGYR